jgi:hypothetical protein
MPFGSIANPALISQAVGRNDDLNASWKDDVGQRISFTLLLLKEYGVGLYRREWDPVSRKSRMRRLCRADYLDDAEWLLSTIRAPMTMGHSLDAVISGGQIHLGREVKMI